MGFGFTADAVAFPDVDLLATEDEGIHLLEQIRGLVTESHGTLDDQALLKLWLATAAELYPAAVLRELGLYQPARHGIRPPLPHEQGLGVRFSRSHPFPVFTTDTRKASEPHAEAFERFVRPLAAPAFDEALEVLRQYLGARACPRRRLRAGRDHSIRPDGAGRRGGGGRARARAAPGGIPTDPGSGPWQRGLLQGTSEDRLRTSSADSTSCSCRCPFTRIRISPRWPASCSGSAGGKSEPVFIIEPSPTWYQRASETLQASIGEHARGDQPSHDPFPQAGALESSLGAAGFAHHCWEELLPGIGLTVAISHLEPAKSGPKLGFRTAPPT